MCRLANRRSRAIVPCLVALATWLAVLSSDVQARDVPGDGAKRSKAEQLFKSIKWQEGPSVGKLGNYAEIKIPAGYQFTDQRGAAIWAELTQNVSNPSELGVLMPSDYKGWFIVFQYEDIGHVKDDEKGKLNAAAILDSIRQGNDAANVERRQRGWSQMEIVGWMQEPSYNEKTSHLTWAIRGRSNKEDVVNHNTRILGRTGVMSANLVCDPEILAATLPQSNTALTGFQFIAGQKYAEWRPGDKMAQYGLTGLITGGAVFGAAKMGLLSKFGVLIAKGGKAIIIGIAALGAGIWKLLTGWMRKSRTAD